MSFHSLCPGSLQIWYHLQTDRSPDVFSPAMSNLADGRLHRIRIHRVGNNLYVQVSNGHMESSIRIRNYCTSICNCSAEASSFSSNISANEGSSVKCKWAVFAFSNRPSKFTICFILVNVAMLYCSYKRPAPSAGTFHGDQELFEELLRSILVST